MIRYYNPTARPTSEPSTAFHNGTHALLLGLLGTLRFLAAASPGSSSCFVLVAYRLLRIGIDASAAWHQQLLAEDFA
jgi:hypothetical protein